MATPLYDALVTKVRDWSNKKEVATIPDSVIQDCLRYSADECYRLLRVPPLEFSAQYTISADNNNNNDNVSIIEMPSDMTEFIYLRDLPEVAGNYAKVYNQITDSRTFLDPYAENYCRWSWMWKEDSIWIKPRLSVGDELEICYYRRLPALDALFTVTPNNYQLGVIDANQLYLNLVVSGGTNLYFAGVGSLERVFATSAEATVYGVSIGQPTVTTKMYEGKEAPNWLRDSNERLLIWGALYHVGAYLFDDIMERRYEKKFIENIASLNNEEKFRRAKGGNVQVNVNTNGLI